MIKLSGSGAEIKVYTEDFTWPAGASGFLGNTEIYHNLGTKPFYMTVLQAGAVLNSSRFGGVGFFARVTEGNELNQVTLELYGCPGGDTNGSQTLTAVFYYI